MAETRFVVPGESLLEGSTESFVHGQYASNGAGGRLIASAAGAMAFTDRVVAVEPARVRVRRLGPCWDAAVGAARS